MKHIATLLFSLILSANVFASLTPQVDSIPMSDGRKLAADIYIPGGMTSGPVILIQTPYNRQLYRTNLPLLIGQNIDSSKYIIVIVDWRGFYGSAAAAHAGAPSLGTDGYNVVEWIAQQTWSNGKVGTWGASALGRVQFQTAAKNPPHLLCICPLVAGPQYEYEEYYPNGVLRTEYIEQLDALGFGLKTTIMNNQVHNAAWTYSENTTFYPDSILVPCYMQGGWYDHTIPQQLPFFNALLTQSPANVRGQHRLLMGPWVHKGVGSATAGQLTYTNAAKWSDSLALLFFDYHLRSISNNWDQSPIVQYFQMGSNTWHNSTAWPPAGPVKTNFVMLADGTLGALYPILGNDSLNFTYNPTDPSPTVGGPTLQASLGEGPYDQVAAVESRNDILTFTTPVLLQDAVMQGNAVVHMKVASNRYDTDFDVRLTDVYPDASSMLVNDGAIRMRCLHGTAAADTAAIVPGQIYEDSIILPATAITFLAGHKIRVDITSSNYPRFNRNMNTGGPQYPNKNLDTLVNPLVATNTVYTNSGNQSYITLPLVGYTGIAETKITQNSLSIYPNPANNKVTIEWPALKSNNTILRVFDMLGHEVVNMKVDGTTAKTSFDAASFANGVYLVKLTADGENVFGKFSVKR